ALLPASPAINAGDPAAVPLTGTTPQFDERGTPFQRVVAARIDMGALETQPNPLAGDYNFDGIVDAADYSVWEDTSSSTNDLRADGDANGSVDSGDFNFWKTRFGSM